MQIDRFVPVVDFRRRLSEAAGRGAARYRGCSIRLNVLISIGVRLR